MAAALENYYGVHNSYEDAKLNDLNLPSSAADNSYQLEITTATANTFICMLSRLERKLLIIVVAVWDWMKKARRLFRGVGVWRIVE